MVLQFSPSEEPAQLHSRKPAPREPVDVTVHARAWAAHSAATADHPVPRRRTYMDVGAARTTATASTGRAPQSDEDVSRPAKVVHTPFRPLLTPRHAQSRSMSAAAAHPALGRRSLLAVSSSEGEEGGSLSDADARSAASAAAAATLAAGRVAATASRSTRRTRRRGRRSSLPPTARALSELSPEATTSPGTALVLSPAGTPAPQGAARFRSSASGRSESRNKSSGIKRHGSSGSDRSKSVSGGRKGKRARQRSRRSSSPGRVSRPRSATRVSSAQLTSGGSSGGSSAEAVRTRRRRPPSSSDSEGVDEATARHTLRSPVAPATAAVVTTPRPGGRGRSGGGGSRGGSIGDGGNGNSSSSGSPTVKYPSELELSPVDIAATAFNAAPPATPAAIATMSAPLRRSIASTPPRCDSPAMPPYAELEAQSPTPPRPQLADVARLGSPASQLTMELVSSSDEGGGDARGAMYAARLATYFLLSSPPASPTGMSYEVVSATELDWRISFKRCSLLSLPPPPE